MKKRILALLLCCAIAFTVIPFLPASAEEASVEQETVSEPEGIPAGTPAEDGEDAGDAEADLTEPLPAVIPDNTSDLPVESELFRPTVDFTDVAPFLDPVTGSSGVRALAAAAGFAQPDDKGMSIQKTAVSNGDGSYTITLEAYATGSKIISDITKDVPTDIILVLDQSGSMADPIGTVSFNAYTGGNARNGNLYAHRHNGGDNNLWHKLEDGSYVSVSVTKQETVSYTGITNGRNEDSGDWWNSYTDLYNNRNNLYAKVNGEYVKVGVVRNGRRPYTYTYTLPDGTQIASSRGASSTPSITSTDDNQLYLASIDDTQTVYTYTYTDAAGTVQTIGTSTGADTVFSPALYRRNTSTSGGGSRIDALKNAAGAFVNAVAAKAAGKDGDISTTADNINHRIAVVGYADTDWQYGYNTGVFIGNTLNRYADDAAKVYGTALQDMSTTGGKNNVTASINALKSSGATRTDYGLTMASGILNANPVPQGETRNRVVIVFTDGSPTDYNGFQKDVANSAISTANTIKAGGTTVYSIGIFSGADAGSAGTEPNGNLNSNDNGLTAACNWFMQQVSSNNGTPRTPSYYLSASDAGSLNSIFQQISDQIETGGSSTTLDEETVIRDVITPAFTLPEGTKASDITLRAYACIGKDETGFLFDSTPEPDAMGAEAKIQSTDSSVPTGTRNQVCVTGFDFAGNYVGTVTQDGNVTYRGHKLVIQFTVEPRAGFFGGNNVDTNESAGVYEDENASEPVLTFEKPVVDVGLVTPEVTVPDANVYLGAYFDQTVPEDAVKSGATVKVGDYVLDFSKADDPDHPYGLEPWQTEYVTISMEATSSAGSFENIREDITYTVTVRFEPKTQGSAAGTEESGSGSIRVFRPALTFRDGEGFYGAEVPADFAANLTEKTWIHLADEKRHDDAGVVMLNEEPALRIAYTPDESRLDSGRYTKQDVPVRVTVRIGEETVNEYTLFTHQACSPACDWADTPDNRKGSPAFLIHVKTCRLTITKTGGAADESYVFEVYKDGVKYSEVTVEGNTSQTLYELPIGAYTVSENTGWSWRYAADNGIAASLTAASPNGSITCTNTKTNDYWLNGFSAVVRNVFGRAGDGE